MDTDREAGDLAIEADRRIQTASLAVRSARGTMSILTGLETRGGSKFTTKIPHKSTIAALEYLTKI
jgi:hypothetical protein